MSCSEENKDIVPYAAAEIVDSIPAQNVRDIAAQPVTRKPLNYGEATAYVEPGWYSTWMESIQERLPSNVRIGVDLRASVTFGKTSGQLKVTYKASTWEGGKYLMALVESLSNPNLPLTQKIECK